MIAPLTLTAVPPVTAITELAPPVIVLLMVAVPPALTVMTVPERAPGVVMLPTACRSILVELMEAPATNNRSRPEVRLTLVDGVPAVPSFPLTCISPAPELVALIVAVVIVPPRETAVVPVAPPVTVKIDPEPVPVTVLLTVATPPVAVTVMLFPASVPPAVTLLAPIKETMPVAPVVTDAAFARVTLPPEFTDTLVAAALPSALFTWMSLAPVVFRLTIPDVILLFTVMPVPEVAVSVKLKLVPAEPATVVPTVSVAVTEPAAFKARIGLVMIRLALPIEPPVLPRLTVVPCTVTVLSLESIFPLLAPVTETVTTPAPLPMLAPEPKVMAPVLAASVIVTVATLAFAMLSVLDCDVSCNVPLEVAVVSLKVSAVVVESLINRLPVAPVVAVIELAFVETGVPDLPILPNDDSVSPLAETVALLESVISPAVLVRLTVPAAPVVIAPPRSMLVPVRLTVPPVSDIAPVVFTWPAPVMVTVAGEASVIAAKLRLVAP